MPGLGCVLVNRLVEYFGSPQAVLCAGDRLLAVPGIGTHHLKTFLDTEELARAGRRAAIEVELLTGQGVSLISRQCRFYPALLNSIHDPPALLYARGKLSVLDQLTVALVGSRAASEYGKRAGRKIAADLSVQGITVISGAAYGVDYAAHSGALTGRGGTIAVLGCGVDVVYPRKHAPLFKEIIEQGLLISEYPMGTNPEGFRFPARNRIISGLCLAVVVVEATEKSGSLITARLALDQGRDVFAVPGRIDSIKSAGCHRLIQQGALLVQSAEDVLRELGMGSRVDQSGYACDPAHAKETEQEEAVLSCMDVYPVDIDTLLRVTGFGAGHLQGVLLQLELKGRVRRVRGDLYELVSD